MEKSLFRKEVLPFFSQFTLLIVATIIVDVMLHQLGLVWIGRYLGIPGTLIILLSFLYSLRKRKKIQRGSPKKWMHFHEICAWSGSLLILVHGGIHFNAILPWLAIIAMLVEIMSGLTGEFLLKRSQQRVSSRKKYFLQQGLSQEKIENTIFWDAVAVDLMKKWRSVHLPITLVFSVLSIIHIVTVFLFWEWK
ncbi:MAG: hypothetical protein HQM12_13680 [SAR324 cluster bacterium]|nr:hypothetical protein [SAR324 cluster bacterium]MBF0349413.1 hypothetical protein [SAR324 cluster bacterium]